MANVYTMEQNDVFVKAIDEYRKRIEGESPKETERLTKAFAKELIKETPLLSGRSPNGVAERLVYFDNLLAGVTFSYNYYLESTYDLYFGKKSRKDAGKEPNKWKTQHEGRRE
jgi:hypothetical protein